VAQDILLRHMIYCSIKPNLENCNLKPATQPPEYKTACGGNLKDPTNYPNATFQGDRIYFCTHGCLPVFEQAPDPFMAGKVEHPLDDEQVLFFRDLQAIFALSSSFLYVGSL
jgi:hypothetical protein